MGWGFLTFETLIVGGGAVFFAWVGTCYWRFGVGVEMCFGERVSEGKVKMWSKVEMPKTLRYYDAEHAHIWSFSYTPWRVEGCQREEANGFGVVELLLRPDCLGR
jgi:hypothetical protein